MIPFLPILAKLISPVTTLIGAKGERKRLKQEGEYKLARGEQVNKAEWEAMGVAAGNGSWKDEYITVIVTLPIPFIFVGNVFYVFTGNSKILEANSAALTQLGALMETPYGKLVFAVALAAIGLKSIKGLFS